MLVNPIHVWSRMAIADAQSNEPNEDNVLFLAVGQEVRSLWLDAGQITAVRDLTQHNPTTLAAWSARNRELTNPTQLCDELIAAGLVAVTRTYAPKHQYESWRSNASSRPDPFYPLRGSTTVKCFGA